MERGGGVGGEEVSRDRSLSIRKKSDLFRLIFNN